MTDEAHVLEISQICLTPAERASQFRGRGGILESGEICFSGESSDRRRRRVGWRVLTEFAPAADDRAVGEPRIDCEEPR